MVLGRKRRSREQSVKESDLTKQIIGGAIEVHKHWGPGLYEEIYERSLCHELRLREVAFESQVKLPLLRDLRVLRGEDRFS